MGASRTAAGVLNGCILIPNAVTPWLRFPLRAADESLLSFYPDVAEVDDMMHQQVALWCGQLVETRNRS